MSRSKVRAEHQRFRRLIADGVDPATIQKPQIVRTPSASATDAPKLQIGYPTSSFGVVQQEWFKTWSANNDPDYVKQMESRLSADVMSCRTWVPAPWPRSKRPTRFAVVKAIEARGANDLARKAPRTIGQVFRFVSAHGYARRNPAMDIRLSYIFRRVEAHNHPRVLLPQAKEGSGPG